MVYVHVHFTLGNSTEHMFSQIFPQKASETLTQDDHNWAGCSEYVFRIAHIMSTLGSLSMPEVMNSAVEEWNSSQIVDCCTKKWMVKDLWVEKLSQMVWLLHWNVSFCSFSSAEPDLAARCSSSSSCPAHASSWFLIYTSPMNDYREMKPLRRH